VCRTAVGDCGLSAVFKVTVALMDFFFFRNQQSEYLGALWADVLAVCRGEVPSSEEIFVMDSVNCWLMYGSS